MTRLDPPIPSDADLRHMPSYMIDVQPLLDSDLAAFGDPGANWYAVLTWCAALHQLPAGSLPDDDQALAWLVRLGRDVRTWRKFRDKGALRGWIKHSDGRLYHPVVTKKVLELLKVSRAGRKGGLAFAANLAAKKTVQAVEKVETGSDDRLSDAQSNLKKSSEQNSDNGREGKGTEGKGREVVPFGQEADRQSAPTHLPVAGKASPKKLRSSPRSKLAPDFALADADRQYARDRNWSDSTIDSQLEKFRNFHTGKGNLMADWHAAWRTWVGNGYDFRGSGSRPPAPSRADTAIAGMFEGLTRKDFDE